MGREMRQDLGAPERRDELGYAVETSTNGAEHHVSSLLEYVRTVRRRFKTLLVFLIALPVAAILYSLTQTPLYSATATVLVNRQNVASTITGAPSDPTQAQEPSRIVFDQAQFARNPNIVEKALAMKTARGSGLTPSEMLSQSAVGVNPNADLLTFTVLNRNPDLARGLANAYASAYVALRVTTDQKPYEAALNRAEAPAVQACATTTGRSAAYCQNKLETGCSSGPNSRSTLCKNVQQLSTLSAVQNGNASVATPAESAKKVRPATVRNVLLALVAGLVLGLGAVFAQDALDTRVRSEDEVTDRLGAPLLGRVATPPRALRRENHLVTVDQSDARQVEAFRTLRTNFDFANLGVRARTVLIVSARENEGKSTTAANLAVTLANSGRSVALVDLDLRQPYLNRFFDLDGQPGLTDVAVGNCSLSEALRTVRYGDSASDNGNHVTPGELVLLPSGPLPPDPAEFVAHEAITEILSELRERYDVVLVDSPPVLPVSDAMIVSSKVDGIIVVAHMGALNRSTLDELGRVLSMSMTPRLGVVLAAAEAAGGYGYGYGYGYGRAPVGGKAKKPARVAD